MSNYREYQQIIKLNVAPSRGGKAGENQRKCSNCCEAQKPRRKITRTKTGCYCCRRRKKKCDEHKPICSGCLRNGLHCVYPTEEEIKKCSRRKRRSNSRKSKSCRKVGLLHSKIHTPDVSQCSINMLLNNNGKEESMPSPTSSYASSESSTPGSPCSTCSSNGTSAYITPISSPSLKACVLPPLCALEKSTGDCEKSHSIMSVRNLLN